MGTRRRITPAVGLGLGVVVCLLARATAANPPPPANDPQAAGPKPPSTHTAAPPEALAQAARLKKQAEDLELRGKLAEAVAARRQSLELEQLLFGPTSPPVADTLAQMAVLLERREEWQAAIEARKKALSIRLKASGENHPASADARRGLEYTKRLAQMTPAQQKQLLEAEAAVTTSILFARQRKLHEARARIQEAIEKRQSVLGPKHWKLADALNELGRIDNALSDLKGARSAHERALAIRLEVLGENNPETARSLGNLGFVQLSAHDPQGARKNFEHALKIFRSVLPENHPDLPRTLGNIGNTQMELGDYTSAKKNFQEAIALRRRTSPQPTPETAADLNKLGNALARLRDFAAARKSHEEALAIRRAVLDPDDPDIAASLVNVGNDQTSLADYGAALKNFEEALDIERRSLPENDPSIALALNSRGIVHQRLRDFDAARHDYEAALAIRRKSLSPDDPYIAQSLNNVGTAQEAQHDYAAARKSFEEAVALLGKSLPKGHPDLAPALNNLGIMQIALKDYKAARTSIARALAIERMQPRPDNFKVANALRSLAFLDVLSGAGLHDDFSGLEESVDLLQKEQQRLAFTQAEQQQLATAARSHQALGLLFVAMHTLNEKPQPVYDRVLRVKGAVTAQQSWARQARNDADPQTRKLIDQLADLNRQVLSLSLGVPSEESGKGRQNPTLSVAALSSRRAELESQLAERSQAYRTFEAKSQVGSAAIQAALPPGTALVDVVEYDHTIPLAKGQVIEPASERRLLAFVTRADRKGVVAVPLGASSLLAPLIDEWRRTYGAKGPQSGEAANPADELRKRLWIPLQGQLQGIETVLVSPDGPLHGLPWGALPGSKEKTYLIEENYAFAVVPVPQLLPELLSQPASSIVSPSLLAVGDIDFDARPATGDTRRANDFARLAGTAAEARAVRDLFLATFPGRPSKLLSGPDATKQAFLSQLADCSSLTVCTHGFFLPEPAGKKDSKNASRDFGESLSGRAVVVANPAIRSGLVFAGANWTKVGNASTFLTALETSELNLRRLNLAVLSACETGRGQVTGGEGVFGLQRSFQLAGARTCVASLWKVDDATTQILMKEFYTNLWKRKLGKLAALRQAQLSMLGQYDVRRKSFASRGLDLPAGQTIRPEPGSPFYWAAFVLSGDWR